MLPTSPKNKRLQDRKLSVSYAYEDKKCITKMHVEISDNRKIRELDEV